MDPCRALQTCIRGRACILVLPTHENCLAEPKAHVLLFVRPELVTDEEASRMAAQVQEENAEPRPCLHGIESLPKPLHREQSSPVAIEALVEALVDTATAEVNKLSEVSLSEVNELLDPVPSPRHHTTNPYPGHAWLKRIEDDERVKREAERPGFSWLLQAEEEAQQDDVHLSV